MPDLTVTLSSEEVQRLEELSKREGLTVAQIVELGIKDLISQPEERFQAITRRVMEKNAELYRRLA
jgi:predicted DNA-binding protein